MDKSSKPVALVTGASSGMGKDIARRLIAEGYKVYGAARRVERMADLRAAGATAIALDVTDENGGAIFDHASGGIVPQRAA